MRGTGVHMEDSSPQAYEKHSLDKGVSSYETFSFWILKPNATTLNERQRSSKWTLKEMRDAVECDMVEVVSLAPSLPQALDFSDERLQDWSRFQKDYCMVVDEELLLHKQIPPFNEYASLMRGQNIHGLALVTSWASID